MRKNTTKALASVMAAAMVLSSATMITPSTASAKAKVNVKKVTVTAPSGKTAYVAKGKKISLATTVKVTPNKKANKKVTYKSANSKIATVSSKGVVKGKEVGTTKITVVSKKNKKKKAVIKVVVKAAAVKKVKISAKTAKLTVGAKKTLKATVTPSKNVCKKVVWSSSKKKVATVSSKGVVKAKAAGTTVITAKAADGSGKKATCKVTVSAAKVNLAKAEVQNGRTLTFTLDKAKALDSSKVVIKRKAYADGTYQDTLKVDSMTTSNKLTYTVTLSNKTPLYLYNYVQINVPSLTGKKSIEVQYKENVTAYVNEEASCWTVGSYSTASFSFYEDRGYASYSISTLPAGLSATQEEGELVVKGTPTKAGTTTATLKATDEYGNTMTKTVYFVIGSKDVLACAGLPEYALEAEKDGDYNVYATAYFEGGSNRYIYKIESDGSIGAKIYSDDEYSNQCSIKANVKKAGTYTVKVRATDKKKSNLSVVASIVINVAPAITVTGTIKDANGNGMPWGSVTFVNKDRANRYCSYADASYDVYDDNDNYSQEYKNYLKGVYKVRIAKGTYDVTVDSDSEDDFGASVSQYKQTFNGATSNYNITMPLYKVSLTGDSSKSIYPRYKSWNVQNAGSIGSYKNIENDSDYTAVVYLKSGTYTLESDKFDENYSTTQTPATAPANGWFTGYSQTTKSSWDNYRYTAKVTVGKTAVSVPVTKTKVDSDSESYTTTYPGAKNTPYTVELDRYRNLSYFYNDDDYEVTNNYYAYKFTPSATGEYTISNSDVYFYDANGTKLEMTDDKYSLTASTTYYVAAGCVNAYEGFRIEKVESSSMEE